MSLAFHIVFAALGIGMPGSWSWRIPSLIFLFHLFEGSPHL